eukprot:Gregarina_sp_Pseudo_9__2257@NODE_258_length_3392_cov_8_881002_g241_i0_p1_GENE_NODE_258_length_3392_cov_8_881002_g241_i0NODE_258_length_3392_cov_8_881002_g241_i0_p1_ORF_typecomplete_len537_score93_72KH_1/PF00013_29/8e05GcnA_N/PF18229_1/0_23_NODE_258_length_3392_cov_8_881002_g241_i013022912
MASSTSSKSESVPPPPLSVDVCPSLSLGWPSFPLDGWPKSETLTAPLISEDCVASQLAEDCVGVSSTQLEPVGGRHRTTSPYAVPVDRSPVTQVLDLHVTSSTAASYVDESSAPGGFRFADNDRVSIRIEGAHVDYELDASDIAQVFRSLTEVRGVHVSPADPSNAFVDVAAGQGQLMVNLLDGRKLDGVEGFLSARLVPPTLNDPPPSPGGNCSVQDGLLMRLLDAPSLVSAEVPQMTFHHSGPSSTPCRPTLPSPSLHSSPAPLSDRKVDRIDYLNLFLDLYTGSKSPPGFPLPASPSLSPLAPPICEPPTTPLPPPSPESPPDIKWTPAARKSLRRTDESTARSTADRRTSPSPTADDLAVPDARVRKWTSRYEIQIDPHDGFQVTRRIIGTRGANMKKINASTGAKLRLRGRGSGYLEGSSRQEADDPLHLWMSSCDALKYKVARSMTEKLLQDIYSEYDKWLADNGRPSARLKIKYKELFLPSRVGGDETSLMGGASPAALESPHLLPPESPPPMGKRGKGNRGPRASLSP